MKRPQLIAIAASLLFFGFLYWGFDTKSPEQKSVERSRTLDAAAPDATALVSDSKSALSPAQLNELDALEKAVAEAPSPEESIAALKNLAGWWVKAGFPQASGAVAEDIAQRENTDEAWSIAGATYHKALSGLTDPKAHRACADKAISAFEKAISLAPKSVEHRVNLALVYAEAPVEGDPMKAVMMLRDLETKYPAEPSVYNALGRLAIKTGQWERAIARLEKAVSLSPDNRNSICLLAQAYEGAGMSELASTFAQKCAQAAQ